MRFVRWVVEKTEARRDGAPGAEHERTEGYAEIPDSDELLSLTESHSEEDRLIENVSCFIQYRDAENNVTKRPITFLSINTDGPTPTLKARCHMRNAIRTFTIQRILEVISEDGEVFTAPDYLRNTLGIDLGPMPVTGSATTALPRTVQRDFRDIILSPLTVLVACAQSDGRMHREEVDKIMLWSEKEATHLFRSGLTKADMSLDEANAIGKTILQMRPQRDDLREHILETLSLPPAVIARFRDTLEQIIQADGVIDARETELLAEFDTLASKGRRKPRKATASASPDNPPIDTAAAGSPDLRGAKFVFTGTLTTMTRAQARALVEARNGVIKTAVSAAYPTQGSYLIVGEKPGSKLQDARDQKVPILQEHEFRTMMGLD